MIHKMLPLLHLPRPEIFHILLFLSFMIETSAILGTTGNRYRWRRAILGLWASLSRVLQRYIAYYAVFVLTNIAFTYLHISLPTEATLYVIEAIYLLRQLRDHMKDTIIRDTLNRVLEVVGIIGKTAFEQNSSTKSNGDSK